MGEMQEEAELRVKSTKAEQKKAETVKAEPVKAEPEKAESMKAEPVKTEPVKAEPIKAEPVKAEPALKVTLDSGIEVEVAEGDLSGAMQLLIDMENEASEKVRKIKEQMRKDEELKIAEEIHQEN